MAEEAVRLSIESHIATVTIDNPPVNALSREVVEGIPRVFAEISANRDVRAAVFTGAGERAFCAGADLKRGRDPEGPRPLDSGLSIRDCFWAVYDCAVPVIAAVNGPALGGGLALVAVCDVVVASERASFGLPEINVGLLGGGRHLQRMVGSFRMRRMMYTGLRVPAAEMERWGCIEAVVPHDQLLSTARALAEEIATKSPVAIRLAKESLNRSEFMDLKEGYRTEQDYTSRLSHFEDSAEARAAWLEKREPVWKGY